MKQDSAHDDHAMKHPRDHEHHHAQDADRATAHEHEGHHGPAPQAHGGHTASKHHGHEDHHRHMIADFKRRLLVAVLLTVPVLLLSPMIQSLLGLALRFPGDLYLLFALSSAVFFYGGYPFLKGLLDELRAKSPGMMTLIALAISVAYFYSSAVVFGLSGKMFFWELVSLIDIMLLGHWIEMRSVLGASRALELLVQMLPSEAHLIDPENPESIRDVPLTDVRNGDMLLIRPGEKVPADGTIVAGASYLNESMLTGESKPVRKEKGASLIGGSINGEGSLRMAVQGTGDDSYLSRVITMVRDAQKTKSRTQRLADRAARWLTFVALTAGVLTLSVWLYLGFDFVFALERMVTVMVISCPHALGLAVPLVVAISTAMAASSGLLIRNRTAFESSRRITTVVFDKTGTLTRGEFGVVRTESAIQEFTPDDVLRLAAALEKESEHPIAVGIVREAQARQLDLPGVADFRAITGKGIEGSLKVSGRTRRVQVVSPGFLKESELDIPAGGALGAAETTVFLLVDGTVAGFIGLADAVREESYAAIALLKQSGIKAMMATGDNRAVAASVSEKLGLDEFFAEVLPHEKLALVKRLQEQGEFVAMTGDGVNDAPALAQADVGIAVGSGTDVAAETADIILVRSDPNDISALILFGRATHRKMIQNLIWATAYNVFAIPLAAGVLYSAGIVLSPAIGAVFMSLSTVIVAINAQLLKSSAGFRRSHAEA